MLFLLILIHMLMVVQCQEHTDTGGGVKQWFDYVENATANCHSKIISSHVARQSVVAYFAQFSHCFTSKWTSCQTENPFLNFPVLLNISNLPCYQNHFTIEFGVQSLVMGIEVHPAFHINLTFYRFSLVECTTHSVQASTMYKFN